MTRTASMMNYNNAIRDLTLCCTVELVGNCRMMIVLRLLRRSHLSVIEYNIMFPSILARRVVDEFLHCCTLNLILFAHNK